jgi:hypothetical protein
MTPLDKRVDWLLALWFVATLWSLFISGTVLLTPALYIFGPLIALALWLLPLLPLLAITWRNRFWARGRLWRWLPVFPLALAIDIMAIPLRIPELHFDTAEHRQWTEVFVSTWIGVVGAVLVPVIFATVLLVSVWRTRPRAAEA